MENLSGQRFGFWTVLEKDGISSKNKPKKWKCKCDCGGIKSVRERHLKIGKSKSCNCGLRRRIDLTGKVFSTWTVVALSEKSDIQNHSYWICRCFCGKEKVVNGGDILRNKALKWCSCDFFRVKKYNTFFDSHYEIQNDHCWIWKGPIDKKGYGTLGSGIRAPRYSYERFITSIPEGKFVCHICDNPSCVNPYHLFLGTPKDNSEDMVKKGRSAKGSKHSQSKLHEKDIEEIISLFNQGLGRQEIAIKFGVSREVIGYILNNKLWRHVPR